MNDSPTARSLLVWAFIVEGGMFFAALAIGWLVNVDPLASFASESFLHNSIAAGWGLAAGTLFFGIGWGISVLPWEFMRQFERFMRQQIVPLFADSSWWELAIISLLAGWGEEILFRGLIQAGLEQWMHGSYSWLVAAVIASVLFGICHALNWTYLFLATAMGFFFAALLLAFDNLIVCIVAHGWYDFLMLLFLVKWSHQMAGNEQKHFKAT